MVSVGGHGVVELTRVCLSDSGGGLVAMSQAQVRLLHCSVGRCGFSGVYAKDAAFLGAEHCVFAGCDVAVRVRECRFAVSNCVIRESRGDGVVAHGSAKGVVERTTVQDSGENGVLLSPSCEVLLAHTKLLHNGRYGVYAPQGADFAFVNTEFRDNAMGDANRQPPLDSRAQQRYK